MKHIGSIRKETPMRKHFGIFRKKISLWESVALIVSGTVGAGVFGIPFAIAQVGVLPGVIVITVLGFLMMGLNLLLGEVVVRTRQSFQLSGLAHKYLGTFGGFLMTVIFYTILTGTLVVYMIGVGEALSSLLGNTPFFWSIIFFVVSSFCIFLGLRTIKTVEFFLLIIIFFIVFCISFFSIPHTSLLNFQFVNWSGILVPYGVVLFAFHGVTAIPEAYELLHNRKRDFKKAIIISAVITMVIYIMFAITVIGVTGVGTTEIATTGLGNVIGPTMYLFGTLFAILAMATSYLLIGVSFKDSLCWDFRVEKHISVFLVLIFPLSIFLLGMQQFIQAISVIGGICVSLEMLLILLIYLKAREKGDKNPGVSRVKHARVLLYVLLFILTIGALQTIRLSF